MLKEIFEMIKNTQLLQLICALYRLSLTCCGAKNSRLAIPGIMCEFYIQTYICVYMCMYICMYIYVCIHVYIYLTCDKAKIAFVLF